MWASFAVHGQALADLQTDNLLGTVVRESFQFFFLRLLANFVPHPDPLPKGEGDKKRLNRKTSFLASFVPHPDPLPEGEGDQQNSSPFHSLASPLTPAISQGERELSN